MRVSRVLSACECRRHRSCCPRRLAGLSVLLCAGFCTALPVSHIAHGTKRRSSERGRRPCALVVAPQERVCFVFSCTSEPGAVDGCVCRFIARCCLMRARACDTSAAVYTVCVCVSCCVLAAVCRDAHAALASVELCVNSPDSSGSRGRVHGETRRRARRQGHRDDTRLRASAQRHGRGARPAKSLVLCKAGSSARLKEQNAGQSAGRQRKESHALRTSDRAEGRDDEAQHTRTHRKSARGAGREERGEKEEPLLKINRPPGQGQGSEQARSRTKRKPHATTQGPSQKRRLQARPPL